MKNLLVSFILLLFIFGAEDSFSQQNIQTESQLAFNYFRDKEYRPASSLFFNLYKLTRSKTYFNYYIESLIKLEDFSEAEKAIKKEIKKNPDDQSYQIALGYIFKEAGKSDKSIERYDYVIEKLIPVNSEIISIANAFANNREYDYAIKTYEKGRSLLKQEHLFHFELANIFLLQKDFEKMVNEFLMAISIDPSQVNMVQNRLQSALLQDIDLSLDEILKNQLLKKIQTEQNNTSFKELLLWYFVQKKQFEAAFTQARSIDLIRNEDGFRLLSLANLAQTNSDFETALKCYQLIIEKGVNSPNYLNARMGDLEVRYLELSSIYPESKERWEKLAERYVEFFRNESYFSLATSSLIQYAHLKSFRLNQTKEAIDLLEKALNTKGMNLQNQSSIKMELADIKLLANEKWDAILLYAQVEKLNKNNPTGFEAKFKKAKVSYFMGELIWAKAQLDAIKGSTSKLIANDAIALSQFISDNTTLDTTYSAMKLFAEAEFLIYQNHYSQALLKLDEILKNHPGHSLSDDVYFKKYEIYKQLRQTDEALEVLTKIITEHPYENLADKALLLQGELFEEIKKTEKAIENYKILVTEYPGSIHSIEARKRLNELR